MGVLDEGYFAYFEDSDYCIRARRHGFDVLYAGEVCATHHGNVSTRENSVDFWPLFNRSAQTFRTEVGGVARGRSAYDAEVVWHSVLHRAPGYALQSRNIMKAMHFAGLRVAYQDAYRARTTAHRRPADQRFPEAPGPRGRAQVALLPGRRVQVRHGAAETGWTMLEVTGLPQEWVDGCNAMDEVWVPASFNVETFGTPASAGPSASCHSASTSTTSTRASPGSARPAASRSSRSSSGGSARAPSSCCRPTPTSSRRPTTSCSCCPVYNRDQAVDVRHEVTKLLPGASPPVVVMVNAEFAPYQMGSLYRSVDCFVLPTRGEGWGMPVLEAMACGLPVIATDWSGPADYLHEGVGYPLAVRSLVPARARCPWYEGFEWAEPDVDHLRFLLREVVDRPEQARARVARRRRRGGREVHHRARRGPCTRAPAGAGVSGLKAAVRRALPHPVFERVQDARGRLARAVAGTELHRLRQENDRLRDELTAAVDRHGRDILARNDAILSSYDRRLASIANRVLDLEERGAGGGVPSDRRGRHLRGRCQPHPGRPRGAHAG